MSLIIMHTFAVTRCNSIFCSRIFPICYGHTAQPKKVTVRNTLCSNIVFHWYSASASIPNISICSSSMQISCRHLIFCLERNIVTGHEVVLKLVNISVSSQKLNCGLNFCVSIISWLLCQETELLIVLFKNAKTTTRLR